jgi:hypothetical protein
VTVIVIRVRGRWRSKAHLDDEDLELDTLGRSAHSLSRHDGAGMPVTLSPGADGQGVTTRFG